ncbi:MAG: eS25 family ribosomal protein [Candidatus Helarchaeota archaeon]
MPKKKTSKSTKKGKSTQTRKKVVAPKKWSTSTVKAELKRRDILIPNELEESIISEIPKMKYITANEIAKKYNIRISSAKQFLRLMEERQLIKPYIKSRKLKIYTAA